MSLQSTLKRRLGAAAAAAPQIRNRSRERLDELRVGDPDPTHAKSVFIWMRAQARAQKRPWRPHYGFSVANAAVSAAKLGIDRISLLEFGVAGGSGLLAMETAAEHAESLLGVQIEVYGFDSGGGLPRPTDRRDVPFMLSEGDYAMDEAKLRARLTRAELVLGLVGDTIPAFLEREPAPIGFIANDLDYYSSTMESFAVLDAPSERLLPRVFSYFDDISLYPWTSFNGERAAIEEYNATHEDRKISPLYGLRYWLPGPDAGRLWPDQIFMAELFDHPLYGAAEGAPGRTLGLASS